MENKIVFTADSTVGTISVYEDYCIITTKQNATARSLGKYYNGEKKFYYKDLTALQYKAPGFLTAGYILFEYPGAVKASNPFESENSFPIMKQYANLGKQIYDYINQRIDEVKRSVPTQTVVNQAASPAEELKKFKELLDMGIITQEEFDAKKKQLLGL